jgi:hypothetical protein
MQLEPPQDGRLVGRIVGSADRMKALTFKARVEDAGDRDGNEAAATAIFRKEARNERNALFRGRLFMGLLQEDSP